MKPRRSWREKLADDKGLPKVGPITGKLSTRWGKGIMVIPAPREVDEIMRQVPRGKLTTINEIRVALARRHQADFGCPITTGIFAWIAARAAAEAATEGRKRVTPYWRTLKTGGIPELKKLLEAESHKVTKKGKQEGQTLPSRGLRQRPLQALSKQGRYSGTNHFITFGG